MNYVTATAFGDRTTGVILSGKGSDGQEGLREINRNHGFAVVQDPLTCQYKEMANSSIANLDNSNVARDHELAATINTRIDTGQPDADQQGYAVTAY